MSEVTKEQSGTAVASVKEEPELIGKELSEADVRREFCSVQRFGKLILLAWGCSLIVAISWSMLRVLLKLTKPGYIYTWADFIHDWAATFLWWFSLTAAVWALLQVLTAIEQYRKHSDLWRYKTVTGLRIGMVAGMVLLYLNF